MSNFNILLKNVGVCVKRIELPQLIPKLAIIKAQTGREFDMFFHGVLGACEYFLLMLYNYLSYTVYFRNLKIKFSHLS